MVASAASEVAASARGPLLLQAVGARGLASGPRSRGVIGGSLGRILLGIKGGSLLFVLILAWIGRLVLEHLDELVEAGSDDGTEEGAYP